MMKRGMTKADGKVTKVTGGKLAKTLLRVVGLGLAAGVALIAATDKTMKKVFPQDEQDKAGENEAANDERVSRDFIHWEDENNSENKAE